MYVTFKRKRQQVTRKKMYVRKAIRKTIENEIQNINIYVQSQSHKINNNILKTETNICQHCQLTTVATKQILAHIIWQEVMTLNFRKRKKRPTLNWSKTERSKKRDIIYINLLINMRGTASFLIHMFKGLKVCLFLYAR